MLNIKQDELKSILLANNTDFNSSNPMLIITYNLSLCEREKQDLVKIRHLYLSFLTICTLKLEITDKIYSLHDLTEICHKDKKVEKLTKLLNIFFYSTCKLPFFVRVLAYAATNNEPRTPIVIIFKLPATSPCRYTLSIGSA